VWPWVLPPPWRIFRSDGSCNLAPPLLETLISGCADRTPSDQGHANPLGWGANAHFGIISGEDGYDSTVHADTIPKGSVHLANQDRPTESENVFELYKTYCGEPTPENYQRIREAILAEPSFSPYSSALGNIDQLMQAEKFEAALHLISESQPEILLSPAAHLIAHYAHQQLNNEPAAQAELHQARLCAEGILSTGKGTIEEPYQVLLISDEYDVLSYLRKKPSGQRLLNRDDPGG